MEDNLLTTIAAGGEKGVRQIVACLLAFSRPVTVAVVLRFDTGIHD